MAGNRAADATARSAGPRSSSGSTSTCEESATERDSPIVFEGLPAARGHGGSLVGFSRPTHSIFAPDLGRSSTPPPMPSPGPSSAARFSSSSSPVWGGGDFLPSTHPPGSLRWAALPDPSPSTGPPFDGAGLLFESSCCDACFAWALLRGADASLFVTALLPVADAPSPPRFPIRNAKHEGARLLGSPVALPVSFGAASFLGEGKLRA
mmetsp:Transcript_55590/g.132548  ORF Transcript_55590/g.132548 Transcript_55590/m.132548 type:complete len:208 (-) Transcript_55590:28-651(-)